MKAETEAVTDDEWLLRRIRIEQFRTGRLPIISPNAFEPRIRGREPDTDGISFYRKACLDDVKDVLSTIAAERRHEFGIVQIPVSLVHALSLSVEIRIDGRVQGHVVIPELNSLAYAENKSRFTSMKERLAVAASEESNILVSPTPSA